MATRRQNIWSDIILDGAGLAEEDNLAGCIRMWAQWLAMSEAARLEMGKRAKACFEARYTSRRAATSMLSNIYQTMHAERVSRLGATSLS